MADIWAGDIFLTRCAQASAGFTARSASFCFIAGLSNAIAPVAPVGED